MTELDATYHELVARLAHIQARKHELDVEETEIKAKLADNLGEGAYTVAGREALTIAAGRRFDPDLAARALPAELQAMVSRTVIDSGLAKQLLSPAVYAQCQKVNRKLTVTVK